MKKIKSSVLAFCALSVLTTACVDIRPDNKKSNKKLDASNRLLESSNRVMNSKDANGMIGDSEIKFNVISESSFKQLTKSQSLLSLSSPITMNVLNELPQGPAAESISKVQKETETPKESLLVGFPVGLVGEQNVFGGVITKVTDKENEALGNLKLTDLPPVHVRTVISRLPDGNPALTLAGCFNFCEEESEIAGFVSFPILGYNQDTGMLVVDFSQIGKELDFMTLIDPKGENTKLKAISSDTVSVEFDLKTLIFDIQTKMVPLATKPTDTDVKTTDFNVRWYLKLGSGFNPAFKARSSQQGVGYFETSRSGNAKITRFSTTGEGAQVKYYIKNVPEEFKKTFAKAIDSWNIEFTKTIGKNLISYEFIDATDPRSELLVTGDVRFNIIEWDLVNRAGYGGLGPSVANQHSGEIMSANVLIQGPHIVKLYKEWFGVSAEATKLIAEGKNAEANKLIKDFEVSTQKETDKLTRQTFKLKLGKHLEMNINSQRPELEDPIKKVEFEFVPANMTYEKYMEGYMLEIVAHEIGHNLGLRHNFKGNLGAIENKEIGSVSRSIMEYLGRPFRYLNIISSYDRMAIAYGYKGLTPRHLNWFCTDEDQAITAASILKNSPECSKVDATSDPFSFLEGRLNRILDIIIDLKSDAAPVWKVKDIETQLDDAITALTAYGIGAEATGDKWTNFFGKLDRPDGKHEVKAYVLERLKKKLCNPELSDAIAAKESAEAQKIARDNLVELRKVVAEKSTALGGYTAQELGCAE